MRSEAGFVAISGNTLRDLVRKEEEEKEEEEEVVVVVVKARLGR